MACDCAIHNGGRQIGDRDIDSIRYHPFRQHMEQSIFAKVKAGVSVLKSTQHFLLIEPFIIAGKRRIQCFGHIRHQFSHHDFQRLAPKGGLCGQVHFPGGKIPAVLSRSIRKDSKERFSVHPAIRIQNLHPGSLFDAAAGVAQAGLIPAVHLFGGRQDWRVDQDIQAIRLLVFVNRDNHIAASHTGNGVLEVLQVINIPLGIANRAG